MAADQDVSSATSERSPFSSSNEAPPSPGQGNGTSAASKAAMGRTNVPESETRADLACSLQGRRSHSTPDMAGFLAKGDHTMEPAPSSSCHAGTQISPSRYIIMRTDYRSQCKVTMGLKLFCFSYNCKLESSAIRQNSCLWPPSCVTGTPRNESGELIAPLRSVSMPDGQNLRLRSDAELIALADRMQHGLDIRDRSALLLHHLPHACHANKYYHPLLHPLF